MSTPDIPPHDPPGTDPAAGSSAGAQPDPQPDAQPPRRPGTYGEIAPGVPRYGQYAPEGWRPPGQQSAPVPPAPYQPPFQPPGASHPGQWTRPAPGQPPARVRLAARLITIAGVLQAVSTVVLVFSMFAPAAQSVLREAFKAAAAGDPQLEAALTDPALLTSVLVIATALSLVGAVLYFWMATSIRRGRNWARIVSTVLAAISLIALLQPNFLAVIQIGLGVVGVAMLYRSPAKEYFTRPTPPRY
ncbi:DUF6264 family protein [Specibacter cremeus]|uniref:DUF6264 family protein n=1 Tax=Specibacter cremeus TaxID=1629051 RepID=UPI000F79A650|nr:DUF6264 family protein [Specibacter cremeus]